MGPAVRVVVGMQRIVLTPWPRPWQILFNGEVVAPGFQKNGIAVSRVGIKMYVTIQELGVQVMFSGLIFSVEVPFSTFANNTEGQCGELWACLAWKRGRTAYPHPAGSPVLSPRNLHQQQEGRVPDAWGSSGHLLLRYVPTLESGQP